MNYLKITSIAIVIGASAVACDTSQECYVCEASDPNGVGTSVTESLCEEEELTLQDKETFETEFTAGHDTASYDIDCYDDDEP
ncbi:MAG: hypothetical protein JKX84_08580 [Flavobacteriales bacterium]|nr:hypothetical protein [Flavobacteriales bacterium]